MLSPVNYGQRHVLDFGFVAAPGTTFKGESLLQARGEDCGTEMVTVTLGVEWEDNQILGKLSAIALVTWGSGNGFTSAEIDFKEGTQFAIPASFLEINIRATGIKVGKVTFSANIAWGSGSRTYATRTLDKVTLDGGGAATVRIPRHSARFFPLPANAAGLAGTWLETASPGGDTLQVGTVAAAQLPGAEIAGPAKFVTLLGAPGAEITPLFLLSL